MHALRFDHFGDPRVLHLTEVPDPVAGDGEAVIAVKASSVNPSDLKNVAGQFAETSLPRTPGRDFAGIVIGGPRDWAGAEVWGTGGDVGFRYDGPHAEMLTIPAAALAHKPEHLSFEEASTVGVNFVTGWLGVVEAAHLGKGETIAVFGVCGGVGSAVAQIAHALGSEVIGMDRVPPADGTPGRRYSRRVDHRGFRRVRRQPGRHRIRDQAAHRRQRRGCGLRHRRWRHHPGRASLAGPPGPAGGDERGRHPDRGDRPG